MDSKNLSKAQQEQLWKIASEKLGKSPEQIKRQAESGKLDQLTKNLSPDQTQKLSQLLKDPKAMEQLMQSQQVQQLLRRLMEK